MRPLIVKPRIDDRYDIGHVVSHAGAKMRAVAVGRGHDRHGTRQGAANRGNRNVEGGRIEKIALV